MDYEIDGGWVLKGEVKVGGSKNATLPLLAGLLITNGVFVIKNVPHIIDVLNKIKMFEEIGVICRFLEKDVVEVDTRNININHITSHRGIRTTLLLLSGLAGRFKTYKVPLPKGDNIGKRLHDMHIDFLHKMGFNIREDETHFHVSIPNGLSGVKYAFRQKSVGATQNAVIAACIANGVTVLENCAMEVEVVFLCKTLNALGANINGVGTETLTIVGQNGLLSINHLEIDVIPDRLQAMTYLLLPLFTLGEVRVVHDGIHDVLHGVPLHLLAQLGAKVVLEKSSISCIYEKVEEPINYCMLQTAPYPGLSTDLHPLFVGAMNLRVRNSMLYENIYENRFQYAYELIKQGATLHCDNNSITSKFIQKYQPYHDLFANDIRCGAVLVLSSLNAQGISNIHGVQQILRGYENLYDNLVNLGARIKINQN